MRHHPVRDVSVARVLSQAPASLGLTTAGAVALLRRNHGSVSRSVKSARRQASGDSSVMQPVPEPGTDYRNLGHAANSCYIASTIAACFGQWDAWDALLSPPPGGDSALTSALRAILREIVNAIRTSKAVPLSTVDRFRNALISLGFHSGRGQQDVTDLFVCLVDWLGAPLLPFGVNLVHSAMRDEGDERMDTERILWLPVPLQDEDGKFGYLLDGYFFGERREGLRRTLPRSEAIVDAWCIRLLLPEYTPSKGLADRAQRNSFDTLAMPFAFKRYNSQRVKQRTAIEIPLKFDFSKYVNSSSNGEHYALSLRSVVCHIGPHIGAGHYVAYTYDQTAWRKWDDLKDGVVEAAEEGPDGLPNNNEWREEILRDSYMIFYELVPGDGTDDLSDMFDASSSGGVGEFGLNQFFFNELLQRKNSLGMTDGDYQMARSMQIQADMEQARECINEENAKYERQIIGFANFERAHHSPHEGQTVSTAPSSAAHSNTSTVDRDSSDTSAEGGEERFEECMDEEQKCTCDRSEGHS